MNSKRYMLKLVVTQECKCWWRRRSLVPEAPDPDAFSPLIYPEGSLVTYARNIGFQLVAETAGDPCDFDGSGSLDIADVEILTAAIAGGDMDAKFDVNSDGSVNAADQKFFVEDASKMNSYLGDGNLDGEFNTNDLVGFFQAGKFETGNPATFAQGDHNADGLFNTNDLVSMFQSGGFEKVRKLP